LGEARPFGREQLRGEIAAVTPDVQEMESLKDKFPALSKT
jgi:hypothetical protein